MIFRHARSRLALWYGLVFSGVLLVLGAAMYVALTRSIDQQLDAGIDAAVTQWIDAAPDPRTLPPITLRHIEDQVITDMFILVYRPDGALVANPRQVADEEVVEHAIGDPLRHVEPWRTVASEHGRVRLYTVPVEVAGVRAGVVIGGRDLAERDAQVRSVVTVLGGVAGAGLMLAAGAGYLLAGRAMRPLAVAYEGQRRFVGDASHELRSPIAVIRIAADLLLRDQRLAADQREAVADIRDVADEAARLVDDLLDLARMEQRAEVTPLPASGIDLAAITASELDRMEAQCAAHGTTVTRAIEPVHTMVSEDEVRRILRALMENVLRHTPAGTSCTVTTGIDGDQALLAIEDAGSGVPEAKRSAIFERFTRVESAHTPGSGSGLGLAIVRTIAARRGGTVAASAGSAGGLRVDVRFPR